MFQIMAWRRPGDKPLSEPIMVNLPTHICVTQPQWVKREIFRDGVITCYEYHIPCRNPKPKYIYVINWACISSTFRHSRVCACSFGKSSRTLTITSHKADKITVSNNRRCISGTLPAFIKIEINQNVAHKLKTSLDIKCSPWGWLSRFMRFSHKQIKSYLTYALMQYNPILYKIYITAVLT